MSSDSVWRYPRCCTRLGHGEPIPGPKKLAYAAFKTSILQNLVCMWILKTCVLKHVCPLPCVLPLDCYPKMCYLKSKADQSDVPRCVTVGLLPEKALPEVKNRRK